MKHYGQYCPMARTSEILSERWTPIIVRNLLTGCQTFSDLLEGAPGISRALLAQRLDLLERTGIVTTRRTPAGRRSTYELSPMGRDLRAVIDAMGSWGARWLELQPQDADAAYVLWATCKLVDVDKIPRDGMVVRIDLRDRPNDRFWMMLRLPQPEICSTDPGRSEDLLLETDSETLARWHLRHLSYQQAVRAGRIRVEGTSGRIKAFLECIRPSPYAHVRRAATGPPGIARATELPAAHLRLVSRVDT